MTNDIRQEVKAAFDEVQMPEGLAARTLLYIEDRCIGEAQASGQDLGVVEGGRARRVPPARRFWDWTQRMSRSAAVVAIALVLVTGSGVGGYVAYATETASVVIQAQASVTLGVNRFGTVVSVSADETAFDDRTYEALCAVRGLGYEEALESLLKLDVFDSKEERDAVVDVQVACANAEQRDLLESQTGECLRRHQHQGGGKGMGQGMGAHNGQGMGAHNGQGGGMGRAGAGSAAALDRE